MIRRLLLPILLLAAACATPTDGPAASVPTAVTTTITEVEDRRADPSTTTTTPRSSLAARTRPLGSAIGLPDASSERAATPVAIRFRALGLEMAPVVPVGVDDAGAMAIPGAAEVGWYRYGPSPGSDVGSAVLAAHIAYNGQDGVFVRLARAAPGDVVEIDYDDGTVTRHVVNDVSRFAKSELPVERLFAKTGDPVLTLITCGGDFNRSLRSYSDNVVVSAGPLP